MDKVKNKEDSNDTTVDNTVDKRKNKIITIKSSEALIEGNFFDIPIFFTSRKKKPTKTGYETLEIAYEWTDSKGSHRGLKIEAPPSCGLPAELEYDVLMGLFKIYSAQNQQLSFLDGKLEMSPRIEFTTSMLLKNMGWKSKGSNATKIIDRALTTLTKTSITNVHSGGLYDIESEDYIECEKTVFHILDRYKHTTRSTLTRKETGYKDSVLMVEFNKFFFENMCNSFFKIINYNNYLELKSIVSKRLYMILEKWRNGRNEAFFKYITLSERIPLTHPKQSYKNKKIRDALDELKSIGVIMDYITKRSGVNIIFKDKKKTYIENRKLSMYSKLSEIMKRFGELSLSEVDVDFMFENIEIEDIRALLRYVDDWQKDNDMESVLGIIPRYIDEPFEIEKQYYLNNK